MKKVALICGALAMVLAMSSCSKERTCRCTVLHESTVRIIKIDKGTCEDLSTYLYDRDPVLYPDILDSLLCTDFDFDAYVND